MSRIALMDAVAVPAAGTVVDDFVAEYGDARILVLQASLTYGSGGTTVKVYVQTSLDGGTTWFDIASFAFATASLRRVSKVGSYGAGVANATLTDAALADNTILDGLIGDRIRVKYVVAGTYTASTLSVWAEAK